MADSEIAVIMLKIKKCFSKTIYLKMQINQVLHFKSILFLTFGAFFKYLNSKGPSTGANWNSSQYGMLQTWTPHNVHIM